MGGGSVGRTVCAGVARVGARAVVRGAGEIAGGGLADVVAIASAAPSMCALRQDQILDGLVFAAKDDVVTDVWSAGRHAVQSGRHVKRDDIVAAYKLAMQSLMSSL